MRQTILGFNQKKAIELELTLDDLLLLQYIMYANSEPSMIHIVDNDVAYVWLYHQKIQEDLPILGITDGTLRNKLYKLKTKNLIDSKTFSNNSGKGSRTYYTITNLTISLFNMSNSDTSFKNEVKASADHLEITPNNLLNNDINTILSNKLDNIAENPIESNLNTILTNSTVYYKAPEIKSKKPRDPDNSRKYQNLVEFINTLNYSENTKEILLKWYNAVGVGKISIKQLRDKITHLYESIKTENEAYESFNNAYINNWMAFYPPKKYYTKALITNNTLYEESYSESEDNLVRNPDGSFMEF